MGNFKVVLLGGTAHGEEALYLGNVLRVPHRVNPIELYGGDHSNPSMDYDVYEYKERVHRQGFYVLQGSPVTPKAEDYRFTPEYQNPDLIARRPR